MQIQPTPVTASLAGTAHAQSHASDAAHASGGGGAAASHGLNKTSEVEAGAKTDDRDADGRQLLEHRGDPRSDDDTPEHDRASDRHDAHSSPSPSAAEGQGAHIDFDA